MDTAFDLFNPEFTITFNGKEYKVRKATMRQVLSYYSKLKELAANEDENALAKDVRLLAYCLYLILSTNDPEITEDYILDNMPGGIDVMENLIKLGFLNPRQVEQITQMNTQNLKKE